MMRPGYGLALEAMEIDGAFGNWLAGFIDGEGCFWIRPEHNGAWSVRFRVGLRDDDAAILEEVQRQTGLGLLRFRPHTSGNPQVYWEVFRKDEQVQLVELLDRYPLRAKKARDYAIWREAVLYRAAIVHRGPRLADWGPLPKLYEALCGLREYRPVDQATRESRETLPKKTHCKHGHLLDEANTYRRPGTNARGCRICRREAVRAYAARKRERS